MKKILLLVLITSHNLMAQTLLVPMKNVDLVTYKEQCKKSGYICVDVFMVEKLKSEYTPKFDQLIETLDLMSDLERKKLPDDIQNILKTEMISVEQLNSLIQICEKALSLESNKKIDFIKKEMSVAATSIESLTENESESTTYMIFKKKFSEKQFELVRNRISNYKYYKIDAYGIADKKSNGIDFLSGDCDHHQIAQILTDKLNGLQTLPIFEKECTFSAEVHKSLSSASNFVVEYKTPLIWTAVAASALLFLKNYDVEFK